MISRISKLNNIGKFTCINQGKDFTYGGKGQNCNIIFGFNGSGKTTLANAFSFFSNNSFISEKEKEEIFNDIKNSDDSVVELDLQGQSKIKYPASRSHEKEIYIFNSNFISTHVFDGTKGKIKKFSNINAEIKNREINRINEQIENLNKEEDKLINEKEGFDKKHEEITRIKSKSFGKSLTDKNKSIKTQDLLNSSLPNSSLETLESDLKNFCADYDLSKKQTELNIDLKEIESIKFNSVDLDFDSIKGVLSKSIKKISKDVLQNKIEKIQNLFIDDSQKQKVEKWFLFGKNTLENIKLSKQYNCPICNTDISKRITDILIDYQDYFDKAYEDFISELDRNINEVDSMIAFIEDHEINTKKMERVYSKYQDRLEEVSFEKIDFKKTNEKLLSLKTLLLDKRESIQNIVHIPKNIENYFNVFNKTLDYYEKIKDSLIKFLQSKKLDTHKIEEKIRKTYKEIILLEFNEINRNGALKKYKTIKKRIYEIRNNNKPEMRIKLATEMKKIKVESKSISNYLIKMGINHFDVDINEERKDENIIIRYKDSATEKNKLKNSLSESEKTALAFAYFLSKFENEINTEAKIKKSVVIVDDPVSSLDNNRLYSTAYLIHSNFENVKQLILLSHNFLFLKYFNTFYPKKNCAYCFFLDKEKLSDLPEELVNFETPYFYMLRNIFDFLDDRNSKVTYNEAKKFLPNFIRRVLETFLSFKFAKTVNSMGGHHSPGLRDFDENIEATSMNDGEKKDIIAKIAEIKRITDAYAHGNLQHTQEDFYISEPDLKILAENANFVIDTMDKMHLNSFLKDK